MLLSIKLSKRLCHEHRVNNIMVLDINRIQALLFDIDGTISDTDDHMVMRLMKLFSPIRWAFRGKDPQPFARWLVMAAETPGNFLYSLSDRFGFDKHLSKLFKSIAGLRRSHRNPSNLFFIVPGVKGALQTLHQHYPMAVVSARDERTTRLFLKHFGLDQFFLVVVTAQTCKHTKPYPDPLIFAAKSLGVPIENCLMIGDTIVDVHAALSAGAQTLSVLCGFGSKRELSRAGTQHILPSTDLVSDFLLAETASSLPRNVA